MTRPAKKTKPKSLELDLKAAEAVRMRIARMPLAEIAKALGYDSPTTAFNLINRAMKTLAPVEEVEDLRQQTLLSLDYLQAKRWNKAMEGDERAFTQVMKCIETRIKLTGMEAPTKHEVSGPDGGGIDLNGPPPGVSPAVVLEVLESYRAKVFG